MFWCRGKGYVTIENFNRWEQDFNNNEIEAHDANYYVNGYGLPDEDHWEDVEKILAEFISESLTYTQRFEEFLQE